MTVVGGGVGGLLVQASVVMEKVFRLSSGLPRNFIPGEVQQMQLRTEDR